MYANCKGRFGVYDKRLGTEKGYYVGASNIYGHNPRDLRYRFQRVAPIHVSPHDPGIVYHASQYVHRTTDEGLGNIVICPVYREGLAINARKGETSPAAGSAISGPFR